MDIRERRFPLLKEEGIKGWWCHPKLPHLLLNRVNHTIRIPQHFIVGKPEEANAVRFDFLLSLLIPASGVFGAVALTINLNRKVKFGAVEIKDILIYPHVVCETCTLELVSP